MDKPNGAIQDEAKTEVKKTMFSEAQHEDTVCGKKKKTMRMRIWALATMRMHVF